VFDTGFIERFARGMAEGGPVIEELALKNNRNNPTFRLVFTFSCIDEMKGLFLQTDR
jgi:hypothetical protein